jgi:enoyl-CoA hydratase
MYSPYEAITAGFLDEVVAPTELHAVSLARASELAGLNMKAHAATKLRVREGVLRALRAAIERELTPPAWDQ